MDIVRAFLMGLRFDIAAQAMLFAPLLLWTLIPWPRGMNRLWLNVTMVLFLLLQIPFAILNQGDIEFINFVGRRFTFDTLFLFNEMQGKVGGFLSTYGALIFFNFLSLCALVGAVFWGARRATRNSTQWEWTSKKTLQWLGVSFLMLAGIVIAIRGGVQRKPLNIVQANRLAQGQLSHLALNSTYTFIKSYNKPALDKKIYFSEKELKTYLPEFHSSPNVILPPKGGNIVLLVLESFGKEYINEEYTPFLNSLCAKSLCFDEAFANGRRSVEGMAAILASVPALMNEPFISSAFSANEILPLGKILERAGYQTSFFHGGRNGTMHFDAFTRGIGISQYFGANEYPQPSDDDGVWGIWDEPFLQWIVGELTRQKKPFFTTIFTLSSHHPFRVPEQYKDRFAEGPNPLTKTLQYSDYALERFFASAAQQPWFENTVFIITADHTALHMGPETTNDIGDYKIPLMIYSPKVNMNQASSAHLAQQMDIPITVLELSGVRSIPRHPLSSSLFADGDKVVVNFIDGKYILFSRDYQLTWRGEELWQIFRSEDLQQQQPLDLAGLATADRERVEYLQNRLRAHIQFYSEGMLENRLFKPLRGLEDDRPE